MNVLFENELEYLMYLNNMEESFSHEVRPIPSDY